MQLQQAVQHAKASADSKVGEIAIVRANSVKVEREYKARAQLLLKTHAEDAARQKAEVDRMRAEIQRLATEKTFLEHDAKSVPRPGKVTTPRKRNPGMDDGFADDILMPLSPSKLAARPKEVLQSPGKLVNGPKDGPPSPRKGHTGVKRKRQGSEGPAPLPAPQPDRLIPFLAHQYPGASVPSIECLTSYHFPTRPEVSLASILYSDLAALNATGSSPSAAALCVIRVWAQCMQERLHEPVHLLLDYVRFVIVSDPVKAPPQLTDDLMALLQETADIVIIPRCQKKPPAPNRACITSDDTLSLVYLMASQLSSHREESLRFWRTMRFDFVMMLLSFIHPLEELQLTLRLLEFSVLDDSFAMIIPAGDGKQNVSEARVIDNFSRFLVEAPRVSQGEQALTQSQLCALRLTILSLVETMCSVEYASKALCYHRLFLGRLVRLMNDSLAQAYDHTAVSSILLQLVNKATRLLFFLTVRYDSSIDMQQKLSVIPGGEKKYLVVLTRLAFSDADALEAGIDEEVVDLAHKMLEERVSPEEAEALVEAMSNV